MFLPMTTHQRLYMRNPPAQSCEVMLLGVLVEMSAATSGVPLSQSSSIPRLTSVALHVELVSERADGSCFY
jgi:hypothetical protein